MVTMRMPRLVEAPLAPVVAYARELVGDATHVSQTDPAFCLYRFTEPTAFAKTATYSVTMGVVLSGTKQLQVEGATVEVDTDHIVVITRESGFAGEARPGPDGPYLGINLSFSPERVAHALLALADAGACGLTPCAETAPVFVMPVDAGITDALCRLVAALRDPIDRRILVPLIHDELLFRLLRSDAAVAVRRAVGQPGDARRILESMQFIRVNHARKLTVDGLARRVAMSPSHFAHRFRDVARISPMRYVRECRLERARTLLVAGGSRANEIATSVGFESAAHFAREFKRRFGAPPSSFASRTAR
jgi:AraC-like DNA-binding protein